MDYVSIPIASYIDHPYAGPGSYEYVLNALKAYMERLDQDEFDAINLNFEMFCKELMKDIQKADLP